MGEKDSSFSIGFAIGAVIGLAIGFLYAPRRGEETRELLKEKAEGVIEKTRETASDAKKMAGEKIHSVEAKLHGQEP